MPQRQQRWTRDAVRVPGTLFLYSVFFITSTIFYSYFGEGYTLATGTPVSIEVWIAVARLYPNLSYDIGL